MPVLTPVYAALLALIYIAISVRVVQSRRREKIAIGTAGSAVIARRMRVHANFAEYVPLALLLTLMVELQGAPEWRVHVLGGALLIGRIAHAYGVSQDPEDFRFRMVGMILTFGSVIGGAVTLLIGTFVA